ncbi:MAG: purine-nucleoside phosphorylase [Kiritimatiellae bacterium]|nr:purine-nucleoside phosphorylase [Kiritimatiellia bacterium]
MDVQFPIDNERLAASLDAVRRMVGNARPDCGLVLGSGWSSAAEGFACRASVGYEEIPALGAATVPGHGGRLLDAEYAGLRTLIFQGRRHWYEGAGWTPIAAPVYLLRALGATVAVFTNAAGGLHGDWAPGALMLVSDHINGMGTNPLQGPHAPFWGPRFPDQTQVYDRELLAGLRRAARQTETEVHEGVYLAVSGPTFETPAEIRAYRAWGADAVGMSTVPEAMLASAAGMRVAAVSLIANPAAGLGPPISHENVMTVTQRALPRMRALLQAFWRDMAKERTG